MEDIVREEIGEILGDDSLVEYCVGLLTEEPTEAESGETIKDFLCSAGDPPMDEDDAASASAKLFAALRAIGIGASAGDGDGGAGSGGVGGGGDDGLGGTTRLLEKKVVIGEADETLAYGVPGDDGNYSTSGTKILVGMRDAGGPLEATSAKAERKKAQERKRLVKRLQLEEERRDFERKLQHEMSLATGVGGGDGAEDEDDEDDEDDAGGHGGGAAHARDVHLRNFDLENKKGSGQLLVGADLTLAHGRRYGFLGRNGSGKTTMLEAIGAREIKGIPAKMSMLLVKQEIAGTAKSAMATVVASDARREALRRTIARVEAEQDAVEKALAAKKGTKEDLAELASKAERLAAALLPLYERRERRDELHGAPEPRARKVLSGLGFSDAMLVAPTASLSGGWRMRVALACALFAAPTLLLLDEPTNHLDLEAVLWLESYLTSEFKGTLLVVSHDRSFLDTVVTDVVNLDRNAKSLKVYKGDVTNFEAVRADEVARNRKAKAVQDARKAHLQKFIDGGNSANVKAARQRKSKMKKLERIGVEEAGDGKKWKLSYDGAGQEGSEVAAEVVEEAPVVLDFPDPGPFEKPIVRCTNASFAYDKTAAAQAKEDGEDEDSSDEGGDKEAGEATSADKPPPPPAEDTPNLLSNVDFQVTAKSRIALLGRNGCGKSTLIKLIVGLLRPNRGGEVLIDAAAKVEYVAQHQLEQLDAMGTPLSTLLERYPGNGGHAHTQAMRAHLGKFGLGGEVFPTQRIHTLSGGQKCRVCLAAAMYRRPHLLILDEPTNHLDLETTDALVEAIRTFQGGVLVVSHDQHLLSTACDELWAVHKGAVKRFDHDFARYKRDVIAGKR